MDVSFVYGTASHDLNTEKDDWPLRMENNLNENNQVRQRLVEKEKSTSATLTHHSWGGEKLHQSFE